MHDSDEVLLIRDFPFTKFLPVVDVIELRVAKQNKHLRLLVVARAWAHQWGDESRWFSLLLWTGVDDHFILIVDFCDGLIQGWSLFDFFVAGIFLLFLVIFRDRCHLLRLVGKLVRVFIFGPVRFLLWLELEHDEFKVKVLHNRHALDTPCFALVAAAAIAHVVVAHNRLELVAGGKVGLDSFRRVNFCTFRGTLGRLRVFFTFSDLVGNRLPERLDLLGSFFLRLELDLGLDVPVVVSEEV